MRKKTTKKIAKAMDEVLTKRDNVTEVCYVFIRKDIPIFAQTVQAAHVCLEAGRLFHDDFGRHTAHIILLKCEDEDDLFRAQKLCGWEDIRYVMFFESNMESLDNEGSPYFTALCTEPLAKVTFEDVFQEFQP